VPKSGSSRQLKVSALIQASESFQALVKAALLTGAVTESWLQWASVPSMRGREQSIVADSKNGESRYVDLNDEGITLFGEVTKQRKPK
jgi:hypothetical protein